MLVLVERVVVSSIKVFADSFHCRCKDFSLVTSAACATVDKHAFAFCLQLVCHSLCSLYTC